MVIFLFLFALLQLWADPKDPYSLAVREGEPATLVEGCVSAITGDLYLTETDAVVQGYIPLRLPRQYLSGDGKGTLANWSFINHLEVIYKGGETEHKITIQEPNGATFIFKCDAEKVYDHFYRKKHTPHFKPPSAQETPGLTNTSQGTIGGHSNLKNASLRLENEGKYITAYCSDQTTRRYKVHHERKHFKDVFKSEETRKIKYLLESESLPSGHKVFYKYDTEDRLASIRTTSPDTHTTYASATFHYHHKHADKVPNVDIELSDGRTLSYRYKDKSKDPFLLRSVVSPQTPETSILYHEPDRHRGNLVRRIALPQLRYFDIDYYEEGRNKVGDAEVKIKDRHNPRFLRVKTLKAPVGSDCNAQVTHRFFYDTEQRFTDVHDIQNARTRYRYSPSMRLEAIERYDVKNELNHKETFEWSESGDLRSRSFYDDKGNLLFSRRLTYDERGNVLKDEFSGNLSGQNNSETYAIQREYSKDGRDLLLKEEEPNGKTTFYTYHSNTNLISAKFLCEKSQIRKRTFYTYNDQHVLVREIEDDGTTQNSQDLSDVKTRLIKQITPISSGPYVGMPGTIEEKYGDGTQECLLKKAVLSYTTGGKVAQQDIYDATDVWRYSLKNSYDNLGQLLTESNALGQVTTYVYDASGSLITANAASGRRIKTMQYDYSNRLLQVDERGFDDIVHTTQCTYDGKHNKTSETDTFGNTTHYRYDSFGHVTETHLPECLDEKGNKVSPFIYTTYDSAGREVARTDAKGHTTTKRYNSRSQVTHIKHPDGTEEQFIYNLDGTLKTQIDAEGEAIHHTYDAFGRRTSTTDPNGQVTRYIYDAFHLIAIEDAEGYKTTYTYDVAGRKIAEERHAEKTQYFYDELGRIRCVQTGELCHFTFYDLLNRVIEEQQADVSGHLYSQVTYTYDEAGNKKSITRSIMSAEQEEQFEYDSFDRPTLHVDVLGKTCTLYDEHYTNCLGQCVLQKITIDALGQKTIQTQDSHGKLCSIEIQNRTGNTCSLEEKYYDLNHNLTRQVSTLFPQKTKNEIVWEYNHKNQLIALNEPLGKTTQYSYTPRGLPKEIIKPDGIILTRQYDRTGNLTALHSSDHTVSYAFTYNKLGQLLTSTDLITNQTTIRTFDHQGRILSEKLGNDLTLSNAYDLQGRRTQLTLPDGGWIAYAYDAMHLRRVSRYASGMCQYTHHYEVFDRSHHLLYSQLIGNLGKLAYTIAPHGACASITSPYFSQTVNGYDAVGNILSVSTQSQTSTYAYDDLYQLIQEDGLFIHSYMYDSHHNRLQRDDETYALNALNQFDSATYDPNGNLLSSGDTQYAYDALDRLISLKNPTMHLTFTYDSFNRRLSKTTQGQTLFFLYDGQNEIGATHSDGRITQLRILGATPHAEIGAAIAIELDSRVYAPIHDLFGNVATLVPLDGGTPKQYTYDSFGNHASSFNANPWRFTSKRLDETGLIYFGRRYYDPSTGRWITADPIGFKGGINLYAFVQNNPLLHHDLYGLSIHTDGILSLPTPMLSAHLVASSSTTKQLAVAPTPSSSDHAPNILDNIAAATVEGIGHSGIDFVGGVVKTGQLLYAPISYLGGDWDNWVKQWTAFEQFENSLHNSLEQQMLTLFPQEQRHSCYSHIVSTSQSATDGIILALSIHSAVTMAPKAVDLACRFIKPPTPTPWHSFAPAIKPPKNPIWRFASPFKTKPEAELHEMFTLNKYDPYPNAITPRAYVNPKNKRQYYLDPKGIGRYSEPSHIDVSRPKGYTGNLPKKKLIYLDD